MNRPELIPVVSLIIYLFIMGSYMIWCVFDENITRKKRLDMDDKINIGLWITFLWLAVTLVIVMIVLGGPTKVF